MSFAMPVAAPPMPEIAPFFAASQREVGSGAPVAEAGAGAGSGAGWGWGPGPEAAPFAQASESKPSGRYTVNNGKLAEESLTDGDRHCALAVHLSPLAFIWIGPFALAIPIVIWLVRKDQSSFVDDHGRETTNFLLSFCLLHVLLGITIIGILLIPVLWVAAIVGMIRGAVAANRNEYFRYPVTIRFL